MPEAKTETTTAAPNAGPGKKFCCNPACNKAIGVNTKKCKTCETEQPAREKKFNKKAFAKQCVLYALNHANSGKSIKKPQGYEKPSGDDWRAAADSPELLAQLTEQHDAWDLYESFKGLPKDVKTEIDTLMKDYA